MRHSLTSQGLKALGGPASAIAMVALLSGAAAAAPAYSVFRMNCAQAQAVVATRGAVVMYTAAPSARGPETYERFVSNGGYCDPHEMTEPAWAPARDNPQCFVGNRCVPRNLPDHEPEIRGR